ncbi:MAG: methylated-DNA--[protein]-cysteine S-methyltransferase [Planctomycetes bacterium]|nr:methylated-DNA--[protein]-cysteine S-methyltransferase [Planctomycetota bacterium]
MVHASSYRSPIGVLQIHVDDRGRLLRLELPGSAVAPAPRHRAGDGTDHVVLQLEQYFAGERRTFDLELAPAGTPFQQRAWRALRRIPFGATRSYQQQAAAIGNPRAMRAVGAANGRNPIAIVVPCHRVIGKDGSLVGFGGGLDCKRRLLAHEAAVLAGTGAACGA